jgi:hypothetical protein
MYFAAGEIFGILIFTCFRMTYNIMQYCLSENVNIKIEYFPFYLFLNWLMLLALLAIAFFLLSSPCVSCKEEGFK